MTRQISIKTITFTGLFAALTCAVTIAIRIPIPGTEGYIHPGDGLVILSGVFLGPFAGALAAALGSSLADLFGGYLIYVPITLVIKGLVAFLAALLYRLIKKTGAKGIWGVIAGGVIDILLVSMGYFVCEIPMYGLHGAALSVPANIIQGAGGLVIAAALYPALQKDSLSSQSLF